MGPRSNRRSQSRCVELRGRHWVPILFVAFVISMPGWRSPATADEPGQPTEKSEQATAPTAESLVVKRQEGAKSPREAIEAFVAAARAGDAEAALLQIDPQFRPLLRAEILLEDYMFAQHLLGNLMMNDKERSSPWNNLGGIPIAYAKRDLVRANQIKVLKERPSTAGKDRILLDVAWRFHTAYPIAEDHRFDDMTTTMLAVRRQQRWYLFHPFGMITVSLQNRLPDDDAEDDGTSEENVVLTEERRDEEAPKSHRAEFVLKYQLPLETVHKEFVGAAQSPAVTRLLKESRNLIRFQNGLRNRFIRGDFKTKMDLHVAQKKGNPVFEALHLQYMMCLVPAVDCLNKKLDEQRAKE